MENYIFGLVVLLAATCSKYEFDFSGSHFVDSIL